MKYLFVKKDKVDVRLQLDEILYITTSSVPHLLHVVTRNDIYQTYNQLQILEEILTMKFYRCHRKYLVNIDRIKSLNKVSRTISFFESDVVDISYSRRKQKELEALWKSL